MRRTSGFTLVETLVVVSIIILLISILMPALGRSRLEGYKAACSGNIRQVGFTMLAYAASNQSSLPYQTQPSGPWLWDVSRDTLKEMREFGGVRNMYYCPANLVQNNDTYWEFDPDFRITGYFWIHQRGGGPLKNHGPLLSGIRWRRRALTSQPNHKEMVADAVVSTNDDFANVHRDASSPHRTNHLNKRAEPMGGNVVYLDGHGEWRYFDDMVLQHVAGTASHWF